MPASSGGGSSPAPRAMKRELSSRSPRLPPPTDTPAPAAPSPPQVQAAPRGGGLDRRRSLSRMMTRTSTKDPTDLVSPPTPPLDAEAPKTNHHAGLMDSADPPPAKEGDGSNPPQLCVGSNVALAKADGDGQSDGEAAKQDDAGMGLDADALTKPDVLTTGGCAAGLDGRPTFLQEPTVVIGNQNGKLTDVCNVSADPPLVAEDSATPASTANLKPTRRFTRSLLKNKPEEEATTSESQGPVAVSLTSEDKKDAAVGSALPTEKPERRFTRSLLKAKVEACPGGGSEEPIDITSHSPPSVKKMEMKMSKKVACLTKHPGNIRELLNTGLLEGMPVMYIIPHSKGMRTVQGPDDFVVYVLSSQREATASFGINTLLIEKYITQPRHIEVQVFGDQHGNVIHLYERDCSLQRRHQKIIEEAPFPNGTTKLRSHISEAAVSATKDDKYASNSLHI